MLPSMALLRALAAPRPAVCRCAARYSTAPPAPAAVAPAPAAPAAAAPAATAPSRSKDLKTAARAAKSVPFTPATQPQIPLSPPRYHVARSRNRNLPIYTDYKRGGNLKLTTVRKIAGDPHELRDELRTFLAKKDDDVKTNPLTHHVVVKGHHKGEIADFLSRRGM